MLLLHWSLLNLAAVAKILKKHDKLSALHGAVLLKAPVLANVLQQVRARCSTQPTGSGSTGGGPQQLCAYASHGGEPAAASPACCCSRSTLPPFSTT